MTNKEAFIKALAGLDAANKASMRDFVDHGGGWQDLSSFEIYDHILEHLKFVFKQGPKPNDYIDD